MLMTFRFDRFSPLPVNVAQFERTNLFTPPSFFSNFLHWLHFTNPIFACFIVPHSPALHTLWTLAYYVNYVVSFLKFFSENLVWLNWQNIPVEDKDEGNCLSIIAKAPNLSHKNLIYLQRERNSEKQSRTSDCQRDLSTELKKFVFVRLTRSKTVMLRHHISLSNNWIMLRCSTISQHGWRGSRLSRRRKKHTWNITPLFEIVGKKRHKILFQASQGIKQKSLSIYLWSLSGENLFFIDVIEKLSLVLQLVFFLFSFFCLPSLPHLAPQSSCQQIFKPFMATFQSCFLSLLSISQNMNSTRCSIDVSCNWWNFHALWTRLTHRCRRMLGVCISWLCC